MHRSSSFWELESCSGSSINGQTAHLLLEGDRTYGRRREIDEIDPKQASGVSSMTMALARPRISPDPFPMRWISGYRTRLPRPTRENPDQRWR
jgi:hypothetical protein